ncbi:DUF1376 domain-containing protein [Acinetobacter radioresistens]|jgi:uncharacterized protein YdaU (DUF1376 family)|uniref:DUF1376 domain-containing protein n=1 Tax=Acinetobacter TaxID=469 RepID=UPI000452D6A5|nr:MULTISPECIES: DUF1376 domain-containing protein [Acinetobacter]EXB33959.1 hypothetical protein J546_1248 [Acinetobacter sp. 1461402]
MNTDATIWMPLYIGDLQAKFTRLSSEQVGATLFLMMDFWKNGPIPSEPNILMSVTKLTSPKTKSLITTLKILNLFEEVNGFIQSNYITTLKEQAILNQKMKSERGKLAAQARWNKSSSNADASDSECSSNAQALLKECPSPSPLPLPLPSSSSSSSSSSQRKDDKNEEKPINRKWI